MPNLRPQVLVDDEYTEQSSYTIDLDLPSSGKLSTLWLGVKATTPTSGGETSAFVRYLISSVSLNQGGISHLIAARPEVLQADYWAKTGKWPQCGKHLGEDASENIEEIIPILLGDKVNDPNMYIDLSKLSDPKLSVTYNLASTGPNGGTLWDTTYYPRFTVVADLMSGPDLGVPGKYFSIRQQDSYTPTDGQIKKLDLSDHRPIRNFMFQFDRTSLHYGLYSSIDKLRIYGDNETWIPFDLDDRELHLLHRRVHGLCTVQGKFDYIYDGANMDGVVDYREWRACMDTNKAGAIMTIDGGSGRQMPVRSFCAEGVTITDASLTGFFKFQGYYPWSIYNIDTKKMLGREFIDPKEHPPLYFEVDHVSNAATIGGPVRLHTSELAQVETR